MSAQESDKFDAVYRAIEPLSEAEIINIVDPTSDSTREERSPALFSMIYHHDPTRALEMLIKVILTAESDIEREWTFHKFDPLIQSRTFYPHQHRMNQFWQIARKRFPHMRVQINETAKLVREYCRMWDKLPKEEVSFDTYPLPTSQPLTC